MKMYVLVAEDPFTGPPAVAAYTRKAVAERIAADPWGTECWCTTTRFRVQCAEVVGAYTVGEPVLAAHRYVEDTATAAWEVCRFEGLYCTHEAAEEAAGGLGAVNEILPCHRVD